ncbi:MAG: recombinase family protein [Firmicutes bacterium]|nr:recombinase family protein [Bacillota bacterium]
MSYYAYIRVSTKEQNTDRQLIAMEKLNIGRKNIYIDKQSGKDFERKNYIRLMKKLKPNDVLVLKSIDRLGRNYTEIINQWQYITKDLKADIIVLDMPLLDTTRSKDLLGTFISDIVLQLLSYVAENERISIRQRQLEGIEAAKRKGVRFGRPRKFIPANYKNIYKQYHKRKITKQQAKELIGCGETTFYKMMRELN